MSERETIQLRVDQYIKDLVRERAKEIGYPTMSSYVKHLILKDIIDADKRKKDELEAEEAS